jgi:hypothetical protein
MLSISPIETAVAEVRALDVLDEADVECATPTGAGTSCGSQRAHPPAAESSRMLCTAELDASACRQGGAPLQLRSRPGARARPRRAAKQLKHPLSNRDIMLKCAVVKVAGCSASASDANRSLFGSSSGERSCRLGL